MQNFDEERFIRIESGAVSLAAGIDAAVGACLEKDAKNLFFLGTGGAAILMQPAAWLLGRRSGFPVFSEVCAELVVTGHRHLGPGSIAVLPSLSGTTRESLAALAYCKERGATTIGLTAHADSPLGKQADHALVNFAEDDTSSESFYLQSLLLVLSLMHRRGEYDDYAGTLRQLETLPHLFLELKRSVDAWAEAFAVTIEAEPYHIITGAGPVWPEAFYYGMCILEEMQWIRTRPVHASDFFHGTLELVEKGVSVFVLKGEDETRPLADRVESFARRYTEKVSVFDTKAYALPGISDPVRALVAPAVLATVFERVSAHLEVRRNHPLTTRRYYKRVDY